MSWKLIDKPKTQKVTKALAKTFAEMDPAPHDRDLSERRLQVYEKLLAAGQFLPVTWASALCEETGGLYRVNGKHTSVMLSGMDKLPEFFATIEEYECETLEDVAKLYATFDSGMQSRTARDIYMSFAATMPELKEASDKTITAAIVGISYVKYDLDSRRTTPAERAELILDNAEFVMWLQLLLAGGPTVKDSGVEGRSKMKAMHLYRKPVVAAMYQTWSKVKGDALAFWSAVRDETGPTPASPARKLSRYLLTSNLKGNDYGRVKTAGNREQFVKCIHAWNAWRKGESTDLRYYADVKVPAIS